MTVFEDLIVELKEENLLEETVIDDRQSKGNAGELYFTDTSDVENEVSVDFTPQESPVDSEAVTLDSFFENEPADEDLDVEMVETESSDEVAPKVKPKSTTEKDFYKKRASGEVSSLQMVEHVLTGVEREYLKMVPVAFEDFAAKKALNFYLQTVENDNAAERPEAEQGLMRETEAWCSTLAERDRKIPASSLRMFCENSKPALSSQALLALARFYRNLPYSEPVRAKFDFVMTRLFSKAAPFEKRACMFSAEDTVLHIMTLYKEWSSVPLYSAADDESGVLLTALGFEDLANEAVSASTLKQLVAGDFFDRLRIFKESSSESFYAPAVMAAAIETNVRIGNAYVKLVDRELAASDAEKVQANFGDINDTEISDALARTLDLRELVRERPREIENIDIDDDTDEAASPAAKKAVVKKKKDKGKSVLEKVPVLGRVFDSVFSVSKWYVLICGLLIAGTIGLYIYTEVGADGVTSKGVQTIDLQTSPLAEHIKAARISENNFYGQLNPSWDGLPKDKRLEFLQKVYDVAKEKGAKQATLIGTSGKIAGFASATRMEVTMP